MPDGDDRPNVLFVMADDHGWQALQSYDSRLADIAPTDNLDRIGEEGARLDNCFCTNSICVPSRASILTGQHSHENGVHTLWDGLDPDHPNVAKELRNAGYRTAIMGKWHLRKEPSGFDDYKVLPNQGVYTDPRLKEKGDEWVDGEPAQEYDASVGTQYEGYSTDIITDLSIDWLDANAGGDDPFCLFTTFKNSHGPFTPAERNADLFEDVPMPEPASLWEDKSHRSPGSREYGFTMADMAERLKQNEFGGWDPPRPLEEMSTREKKRHAHDRFVRRYLRSVAGIDQNVGRLLDYLDEAGLAEDTVVIYTSDQGFFLGEHDYIDKRWMFETSLRMPFLIRHPGEIEPGTVVDDLVANVDFAPTFLDYAGVDVPDYMQGRSMRPALRGDPSRDRRDAVYYRYWMHGVGAQRPAHYGLRTERYKLIFYYGLNLGHTEEPPTKPGMELYDLARDPNEMDNVYDDPAYADVADRLFDRLLEKKAELGDEDEDPELLERRRAVR